MIPIAPLMFVWDGLVSCLRQWTQAEWEEFAAQASQAGIDVFRQTTVHSERIAVVRRGVVSD